MWTDEQTDMISPLCVCLWMYCKNISKNGNILAVQLQHHFMVSNLIYSNIQMEISCQFLASYRRPNIEQQKIV
jgi:hypothetical protein